MRAIQRGRDEAFKSECWFVSSIGIFVGQEGEIKRQVNEDRL